MSRHCHPDGWLLNKEGPLQALDNGRNQGRGDGRRNALMTAHKSGCVRHFCRRGASPRRPSSPLPAPSLPDRASAQTDPQGRLAFLDLRGDPAPGIQIYRFGAPYQVEPLQLAGSWRTATTTRRFSTLVSLTRRRRYPLLKMSLSSPHWSGPTASVKTPCSATTLPLW